MVARLTPDQKVACSIHVGFNSHFILFFIKRRRILLGRMRSFSARVEPKSTSYSIG